MPDPISRKTPPPLNGRTGAPLNGGDSTHAQPPVGEVTLPPYRPQEEPVAARAPAKAKFAMPGGFLPAFLGMLAALLVVGVIAAVVWLGISHFSASSSSSVAKSNPPASSAPVVMPSNPPAKAPGALGKPETWVLSAEPAQSVTGEQTPDIGWWTRTFYLPSTGSVSDYLKGKGIQITRVTPVHYDDTADATTITYQVEGTIPDQLIHVPKATWAPSDPTLQPLAAVTVLNHDLPAGQFWNTAQQSVAQPAGTSVNVAWKVRLDKTTHIVGADRLSFANGDFTPQQVAGYETETNGVVNELKAQVQAINARLQADVQARLAQVPADPPKPELMSTHWNHGDGSGEPTKSAERMGGATVAGAAGGAAFGAAAGDAGEGAGIGAGVGLLGGFIYDTVSKNNDRHRYENHARAVNAERMSEWRAQVRALDQQRDQIKKQGVAEEQQQIQQLATRLAEAGGNVDAVPMPADTPQPSPPVETPITPMNLPSQAQQAAGQAPPPGDIPTESSSQPSGPIRQQ